MRYFTIAALALSGLLSGGPAAAAAAPATCAVTESRLLRRFELDVPGATRVTRSVDIPADTDVLVEAYESHINAWLEIRDPGAEVVEAESGMHRWPPHRAIVAKGAARKVQVTVVGIERAHGRVDLRISRLADLADRRCADFLRAMAAGDAAYARGARIFRAEVDAAPGVSEHAYESAVEAYARAAGIADPAGFDAAQALLVRASALMTGAEKYPEAVEAAAQAAARFTALGHDYGRDLARFTWAYSLTYDAMRVPDTGPAKRQFELARSTFVEVAASHERRGERFEQSQAIDGMACDDGFLFHYADAIAEYQQVVDILVQLQEPDRAVSMRHNVAYFESQFGRYQEALKRHLEILAEGENVKDPLAFVINLRSAAFHELKLGKYDAALRHYSDAYARSMRMQSARDEAWALYGLGNAYHAIGNYDEAQAYLERSLDLRPDQQRPRDRAITLRTLANVLGDTGRGREAIQRREEALRNTSIPAEKARITLELIDDRLKVGDIGIAKDMIAPLLATPDLPDPAVRIGATLASARISLAEGDAAGAVRDATTAVEYYRAHELVSSEFAALLVQARAACAAGSREQALDSAQGALQRAEEVRTFSSNPTLRASLWRPVRPAFGFTIGLLARPRACGGTSSADPLGSLAIVEASRGRALEDFRLRESAASTQRFRANEQRRELFERLAGVRQQIETLSTTASSEDERLKILGAEAARLRREIDLSGGLPDSTRRRAEDLRPALRARIDAIPSGTAVVEYWIGQDEAFAWLLTRGHVQVVDLGQPARIDAAARRLYDAMHAWVSGGMEERLARARELHSLIIAPLPRELSDARTVYFIPDGALHAVPFAALATGEASGPRFLIDSYDVAVAPAFLAVGPDIDTEPVGRSSRALVVVDPVYARDDPRFTRAPSPALSPLMESKNLRGARSWVRLPATAREAATISKLLLPSAVQVLSGFDANRDALLGRDLSRYDILHFATHAIADTQAPQLSALVLSTLDVQGKPRVGEVFAGDLADQHLNARLVVLSGCETALGRAEAGEGLLGLRYAAHASGARAVVASLWPVEDAAGARLMDDLYADVISRHESPVAALSRAARSARARWKDPALWAAFDVSVAGF